MGFREIKYGSCYYVSIPNDTHSVAVPVCKVEDGSGRNFLESDTLWINPKASGLSHSQQGTEKG